MTKKTAQYPMPTTEAAARERLIDLGAIIRDAAPLVEQFKRLQAASEILRAAEAEASFINEHLDGIRASDLERAISEYTITDIKLVGDPRNEGMRHYTVHGTYRGAVFVQPLNNHNRVFLTAVSRRPELIPTAVLQRDPASPFDALMKHYGDVARGYINA